MSSTHSRMSLSHTLLMSKNQVELNEGPNSVPTVCSHAMNQKMWRSYNLLPDVNADLMFYVS